MKNALYKFTVINCSNKAQVVGNVKSQATRATHVPFQHVIKDFSDIIASEALTLHLLIVIHLTLAHFTIVKLVPLGRLVCPTTKQIIYASLLLLLQMLYSAVSQKIFESTEQ